MARGEDAAGEARSKDVAVKTKGRKAILLIGTKAHKNALMAAMADTCAGQPEGRPAGTFAPPALLACASGKQS